jgi:hypothetical protein
MFILVLRANSTAQPEPDPESDFDGAYLRSTLLVMQLSVCELNVLNCTQKTGH